jgi:regulator of CtrA degradation
MGNSSGSFGRGDRSGVTVSFGERFAASDQFDSVFKQGMALVERTAAYLDGEGRRDAKALKAPLNVVYATESMRLTTRLLELASWLLIRRGLKDGDMTVVEAAKKRERVKLRPFGRPSHIRDYDALPPGLRGLIEESFTLNDRIMQIDRSIEQPIAPIAANPVAAQISALETAFGANARR